MHTSAERLPTSGKLLWRQDECWSAVTSEQVIKSAQVISRHLQLSSQCACMRGGHQVRAGEALPRTFHGPSTNLPWTWHAPVMDLA